ncbi:MAG: hypothetical protein ACLP2F_14355 [Steroidobacteraceae bacterium]
MNETAVTVKEGDTPMQDRTAARESSPKLEWVTPRMEDVSEQVTAQPYIRFT